MMKTLSDQLLPVVSRTVFIGLAGLMLAACGSSNVGGDDLEQAENQDSGGDGDGSDRDDGVIDQIDGDGDAGGDDDPIAQPRCGVAEEPGTRLTATSDEGLAACAGVSVDEFVAAIHQVNPQLSEVTELHNSDDGSLTERYYSVFRRSDGILQAAFYQGSGDCPSGCINAVWTYFEADENCEPTRIGSYSDVTNDAENCREVSGEPLWGYPVARPNTNSCGSVSAPSLEGTYDIPFEGTREPCALAGVSEVEQISGTLQLTIAASPSEPDRAILTFESSSLEEPWFETTQFSASVDHLQYYVDTQWDNLPAECFESRNLSAAFDFEVCFEGKLSMDEAIDTECGVDYCKGRMELSLDLSAVRGDSR